MKLVVSNIDWDYPEKGEGKDCSLPTEITINNPSELLMEDIDGYAENLAEYLSNTYGYCVCGFTTNTESE